MFYVTFPGSSTFPDQAKDIVRVSVCACVIKWAYPYVFISVSGSYVMGRHK